MAHSSHHPPLRLVPRQPRREMAAAARRAVVDRALRPTPRPPEGIAAPRVLARHARTLLAEAVRVARWAEGRPRPWTEAPQAEWDRARLAGLVEVQGDYARPAWRLRAWDRDERAVLRGWVALFDAWSLAHPAPEPLAHDSVALGDAIQAMPQMLALLHLTGGPVRVPVLLDLLGQRVEELRTERCEVAYGSEGAPVPGRAAEPPAAEVPDAELPELLAGLLDWALEAFASVGALTREGPEVSLTPLGHWAVWMKIEQICIAAQGPEGHIEKPAEAMLRSCAGLTPGPARAEYRAWLAARPSGSAVAELLEVARGDDALLRGLAFEALRVVGAAAEGAVREACDEPMLRPYALLWLAEQEGGDADEALGALSREEATWLWVDTAAAVADHGEGSLLVRHLESAVQGSVPALLAEVGGAGHPRTVQVLVALAAAHPDPAVAKAVRRAAFRVHTGGA